MPWNWELPDWPHFTYDPSLIAPLEKKFLLGAGSHSAFLKNISTQDFDHFIVETLSTEGLESSKIEGEFLDRESLQSSIKRQFGLKANKKETQKESCMASVQTEVYKTFDQELSHEMLWDWHSKLFLSSEKYRTHKEPMQIISNRYDRPKVFFEAPPSSRVPKEMKAFVKWFNSSNESILGKSAIAHIYFESIHPFEDGNGRIGRLLSEKILSQGVGRPTLIALSKILEKRKKEYYAALERCNKTLKADHFVQFFAEAILQAQDESMQLLAFLIEKSKMMTKELNPRQEKVLLRMFNEGPEGFKGGLSAENYISITKASRATVTRDLTDLVEKGALVKTGELRHTRYFLNLKIKQLGLS